jgi:hypothetical protein
MSTETVINRPAPFVEDIGKKLSEQALGLQNVPVVTTGTSGLSQMPGETPEGFKLRQQAAQAFDVRKQNLAGIAPQVAGQTQLQKDAQALAQQGIGSYQPFLQGAQAQAGMASGLGTLAGQQIGQAGATLSGVPLGAQAFQQDVSQFMSPYQSQVIDTTLQEFDRQRQMQQQKISDAAVAAGAFGGGREGVAQAEYAAQTGRDRAALQAQLLAQGFGQAQAARQQDIANRFNLGQGISGLAGQLQGLGGFRSGLAGQQAQFGQGLQQLQGTDIARIGSLGALNQAQKQAEMDAQREATKMAAYQPQEELDRFADITTGIMGGMRGSGTRMINTPSPSPLQSILGIGSSLAGAYLGGLGQSGKSIFG